MNFRNVITLLVAILSAASMSAQKQLTIVNEDTGESFEVTVPDGLTIYAYDATRLDSIPYLMEHARNREPWAYENLARCYRYGIGVEKCVTNAMIYYEKAGVNGRELAENTYSSDPTDELGFLNHLMEELDKNRMTMEEAMALLDSYPEPLPNWGICMKRVFNNRNVDDLEGFVKSTIDLNTITGDEMVASIGCLMILRPDTPSLTSRPASPEFLSKLSLVAEIIPAFYEIVGDKYLAQYEDCPRDEQAMKKAFEMYHKAYLYGLLDMRGALAVLDYRDENPLYEGFPFSEDELSHLDGFYSKDYRIHYKSSGISEGSETEDAVDDESPVVLESEAYQ